MYSFCNIVLQTNQIYENSETMAGHSKFKNIMHRKGAQDKKRAKVFGRLIKELTVAARSSSAQLRKGRFLHCLLLCVRGE